MPRSAARSRLTRAWVFVGNYERLRLADCRGGDPLGRVHSGVQLYDMKYAKYAHFTAGRTSLVARIRLVYD